MIDWCTGWSPVRGGLPNFPIPDTRLRNEAKNRWFIIVVGPSRSRFLSHDRSEEIDQRVALTRPPPNIYIDTRTSLETIFRIFRIFVDPFLSACNFVKFCFSISGIGCLVTDRFFPFFELDQAPLLLLVAEKKRNSLASYPWLDRNIHKVTMIHVQLYTIYLIEPAIYMYI